MKNNQILKMYSALKTITKYQSAEKLRKDSKK